MTVDERPAIVRAEAIHVRVAFRRPLLDTTGEYTHRRTWLLRLVDEAGTQGFGEAAVAPTAQDAVTESLARLMRELIGQVVNGELPPDADLAAEGEPGRAVLAAMSGAFAGLLAATAPPARQVGVAIPVSATIAFGGPDAGAEAAAQATELDFETLELRAGFERETGQLVDRLRAIRAAIGPEPRLRIDAGGAWDLDTATERMLAIEPYRIEYVEQPLAAWDLTGHAALRERVAVPVALDESIDSEGAARAALAEGAADVLVVKPARIGGERAVARIAEAAARSGRSIVLGTFFESGVGIAANIRIAAALEKGTASTNVPGGGPPGGRTDGRPRAHALATAGVLVHDLLATPLAIDHGRMPVPAAVTLDEPEVGRLAVERVEAVRERSRR